jgi:hypothetical protein
VALGVVAVVFSRGGASGSGVGPSLGDHWHAALGVNICGWWKENMPEFVSRPGSRVHFGLHTHGDGLIHVEPSSTADTHENATLGRFFDNAGWELTERSIEVWDKTRLVDGAACPSLGDRPVKLRWTVNGTEQQGDPRRYLLSDQDVIAVTFLPEGEELGPPPQALRLKTPTDTGAPVPPGPATQPQPPVAPGSP